MAARRTLLTVLLTALVVSTTPAVSGAEGPAPAAAPEPAAAEARRTGRQVPVPELTTETSTTVADPSGAYKLQVSTLPQRVRRGDRWAGIDLTLKPAPDGVAPAVSPADVTFSAGGNDRLARFADGGRWIELAWPGVLPPPLLSGDTATYPNVLPDVDIKLTASVLGFSEVLVVRTRAAALSPALAKVRFLTRSSGVSLRPDGNNGADALDPTGAKVFQAESPQMWDSAQHKATMPLGVGEGSLTVTPDPAILTDPAAKFPLYIDPSFSKGRTHWGYIDAAFPGNKCYDNHCKDGDGDPYPPRAGRYSSAGPIRSMFAMNTSPLPTGAQIITGDSNRRTQFTITATWTPNWSCSAKVKIDLWRIHGINGDETWNNFRDSSAWLEKLSSDSGSFGHDNCAADYMEFDFTKGAQEAADGGWDTTTLGLRAADEGDSDQWTRFKLNPGVTVWYNRPPSLSVNKVNGKTCTSVKTAPVLIGRMSGRQAPALSVRVADPDKDTIKKVEYNWYNQDTGATTKNIGYDTAVHAPGATSQMAVPAGSGNLPDALYSFWARAWDGNSTTNDGWGPWLGPCFFKVDSRAPDVPAPTITPVANPDGSGPTYDEENWGGGVNVAGSFRFGVDAVPGAADVHHYKWSLGSAVPTTQVAAGTDANKTSVPVVIRPSQFGPTVLNVLAEDAAGNKTSIGSYTFLVSNPDCPQSADGSIPDLCPGKAAGFWRLTEGSGTQSQDLSAGNHRLVFGAGTSWGAPADGRLENDSSVRFTTGCGTTQTGVTACQNSTDATGKAPVIRTDQSFTVTAWVRLDGIPARNSAIVSQVGENTAGFALHYMRTVEGPRWAFDMQRTDKVSPEIRMAQSTADTPLTTGWTHLAGVYDATERKLTLFVNGRQMPDHNDPGTSPIDFAQDWNATGSFQVGRSKWGGEFVDQLNGWVSDVHIYPGAFTDANDFLIQADMSPGGHL
jgi:hypothetical protein